MVRRAGIPSVGDRVSRRIVRLGSEAVALARAMAVLDDGGRLADAAAVAGLAEDAAAKAASRMRRIEILAGEDPFAFVHPLVRRSVYDALSVSERDSAHRAAADRLRARARSHEEVAAHLAAVRPARSPTVVKALRDAAREAMARAAPEAAIRWLTRALEEGAPVPSHAVLLHELGRVELLGRDPRAIEHLQAALELAEDPVLRPRRARPGRDLHRRGALGGGRRGGDGRARRAGRRDAGARAWRSRRSWPCRAPSTRLVDAFVRDASGCSGSRTERGAARALAVLLAANAAARGERPAAVRPLVERGLRDGRLLAERGAGGLGVGPRAHGARRRSTPTTARSRSSTSRRPGAMLGSAHRVDHLAGLPRLGVCAARRPGRRRGRAAAVAQMGSSRDATARLQRRVVPARRAGRATGARRARGRVAGARARPGVPDTGGARCSSRRAAVCASRGGTSRPRWPTCGPAAPTYAAPGFGLPFSSWRSALAVALAAEARDEALGLVAAEEVATATATGLARPQGVALRAAGLVRGGEEGLACLRDSVSLLRATPARLEHARSLVELGAALRRRGQRAQAREPLAAGMELAHSAAPNGSSRARARSCAPAGRARAVSPAPASTR